jgi:hypothetical protein
MRQGSVKELRCYLGEKSDGIWKMTAVVALEFGFLSDKEQRLKNCFGRLEKSFPA